MSDAIQITIDGRAVDVEPGQTVLDAARKLGIDIPTLCYLEKCGPLTSCLACVVKVKANGVGKIVPSCGTVAQPGMVIESETDEVREARRTAMELLLSDHVGDCLSPCQRLCPLGLEIPKLIRHVQRGDMDAAAAVVDVALPLPGALSRLCHAPCENGCRRGTADQSVAIRDLERATADALMKWLTAPVRKAATEFDVVVVGSGPTGLSAAFALAREGHTCVVVDRNNQPGGSLVKLDETVLAPSVIAADIARLQALGVEFKLGMELGSALTIDGLLRGFDAVLLAPGELPKPELPNVGVATTASGIKINDVFQTNIAEVFAAGSAIKPVKHLVRAMSDGVAAAECIHQFLTTGRIRRPGKAFSSIMGRLEKSELDLFLKQGSPSPRVAASDGIAGFNHSEACAEAARCVHCDCRAAGDCRLQSYAAMYGADPGRFREQRRLFEQNRQHGHVIYEPGKCIRCGICVHITEAEREPLGLTFVGRGFDVQVAAPMNATIAEGLRKTAEECVEECPTGALVRHQ